RALKARHIYRYAAKQCRALGAHLPFIVFTASPPGLCTAIKCRPFGIPGETLRRKQGMWPAFLFHAIGRGTLRHNGFRVSRQKLARTYFCFALYFLTPSRLFIPRNLWKS